MCLSHITPAAKDKSLVENMTKRSCDLNLILYLVSRYLYWSCELSHVQG